MIANPPYGKDWKRDEETVRAEHDRGASGRFAPGLPRISDGQLLFLLHMLARRRKPEDGGSRIAIIMNGSPLFTGDAGSGESEIRRYVLENDWLDGEFSKIFPTTHFGFRKITVERPLRLNVQATPERFARLEEERAFQALTQSKKKGAAGAKEQEAGRIQQEAIRTMVRALPETLHKDRAEFEQLVSDAASKAKLKLAAPVMRAILSALSERDETAAICRDEDGNPEADPDLRDTESVPLAESVDTYFAREVAPHVPDAWIDTSRR